MCYPLGMNTHPAAYLRRSYVDDNSPGDISLEAQREAVRKLATADGHNGNLQEYSDWGISADVAKAAKRTAYAQLLADMEAGKVSAVYAFDVDRLYRDPRDLIRLQDAAQRHQVKIATTGGALAIGDGDDPAAEGFAFMGAVFGRMELQKARKRARAAQAARRARGDVFGKPAYGYRHQRAENGAIVAVKDPAANLKPIRQAYLDAGTVLGAVKLLNARGIPSPKGRLWHTSALTRTLQRHWPELLPQKGASGKRIRATSILSQLIRCHCGHVMTPNNVRGQLYCPHAVAIGRQAHGRYNVLQKPIIEWAKVEAARLRMPGDVLEQADADEDTRQGLEERRRRVLDNYEISELSKEERDEKLAQIRDELSKLDAAARVVELPQSIDWEKWPAANINAVLRDLWEHIQLDAKMQPTGATWRLPHLRAD